MKSVIIALSSYKETAMKERCIIVDENDCAKGYASKRDCHRVGPDGHLILHRAFSVYLFNTDGDLLMQRRSKDKMGTRKAAQRRLHYELGVPYVQAKPKDFQCLTRCHYYHNGDGVWGEHELGYVLFLHKNVDLHPNPNEVSEIRFIKRKNLEEELQSFDGPLSP